MGVFEAVMVDRKVLVHDGKAKVRAQRVLEEA